jgi:peptide/nickel transport system ATP-binding protein
MTVMTRAVTSTTLLSARHLRAAYEGKHGDLTCAVDDVDLTVARGEVVGIAGESGCGKSTLAAVLSLTARPPLYVQGGQLTVAGRRVSLDPGYSPPRSWRGTAVSLLPQGAMNSVSPTTRIGNVAVNILRSHVHGIRRAEALDRTADRLEQLHLPRRVLHAYPHQLSGGMKQRVVTVLSTLLDPELLIADEPTSALDVSTQQVMLDMLREMLHRELVRGIILVTHDLPVLRTIADRIAIMYAGQILEVGPTEDIINRARHPYTGALLASVLVPEPHVRSRHILGIRGAPPDLEKPPAGCRFHPRCSLATDVCAITAPPVADDEWRYARCWWAVAHPGESVAAKL